MKIQKPIPSELLFNADLSATAFKLWALINYQPDNWKFSIEELFNNFSEKNKKEIILAQFELETWGYLRKSGSQNLALHNTQYSYEEILNGSAEGAFNILERSNFSTRVNNCFDNEEIFYVGDLVRWSETDLLKMANFGSKSLPEIKEFVAKKNLHLGMKMPESVSRRLELLREERHSNA